jgi:hypothetical protein
MKRKDKIERFVADTKIDTSDRRDCQVLSEILQAHEDFKHSQSQQQPSRVWRTFMTYPRIRTAAVVAVALVLAGAFSFGGGTVAFSQARHAVSSTLSRLKSMLAGTPVEEQRPTALAPAQDTNPNRRTILCQARLFDISEADQDIWQRLKDQGIEFVEASADPEVYYTTLRREQTESFDASSITLRCIAAPKILFLDGDSTAIATRDSEAARGLAIGLQSEVSSDGTYVRSTLSVHDGLNGFEIPDVGMETGGAILIRGRGVFPGEDGSFKECLIRVQMNIQ